MIKVVVGGGGIGMMVVEDVLFFVVNLEVVVG